MINLLIRLFVKNKDELQNQKVRSAYATLASVTGIFLNFLLFVGKLVLGLITASVAIVADAFNNITDAGSSVVALFGFRLSNKHVDKEHPMGHGRMEYVTGFIVDMLIILVGFELFSSSLDKIFHPIQPSVRTASMIILGVSVLVKIWLYVFYKKIGNKIDAAPLRSAAKDSLSDCIATTLVIVSVVVAKTCNVVVDGYAGVIVAALILFTGVRSAKETIDLLLGTPPSREFVQSVSDFVRAYPEIVGIHDLMVHDYGVGRKMISFHAEIPSDYNVNLAHEIIDRVERDMRDRFGAIVTIHFDPIAVNDKEVDEMRSFAIACMKEVNESFSLHDFRMTKGDKYTNLIFDLVVPVDYKGDEETAAGLVAAKIKEKNPNCFAVIQSEHPFC